MAYDKIKVPAGDKITIDKNGKLQVSENPVVGFIEGDGIGPDITKASMHIWNAAVEKAYGGKRKISWMELYAGEKANAVYGKPVWLPEETVEAVSEYLIAIKGPLTTPIGGGFRSLNVALRQQLDLYACVRPVRYFRGVPSPVKAPEKTDMVVFRENTDIRETLTALMLPLSNSGSSFAFSSIATERPITNGDGATVMLNASM